LLSERDRVARASRTSAHRGNALCTRTASDAEMDPTTVHHGERRSRLRSKGRRTKLQVEHIAHDGDVIGVRDELGEQRPGIKVRVLVRMVLHGEQVETRRVGLARKSKRLGIVRGGGVDADPKPKCVSVVGHEPRVRRWCRVAKGPIRYLHYVSASTLEPPYPRHGDPRR